MVVELKKINDAELVHQAHVFEYAFLFLQKRTIKTKSGWTVLDEVVKSGRLPHVNDDII